jgi:predicted DNA-binding transcriptional regulator AlpA
MNITYDTLPQAIELLHQKIDELKQLVIERQHKEMIGEIIDRKELMKRLAVSEPTVIRWERKGEIPVMHLGESARYNWKEVIEAIKNKK